ncbi:hypothetical protein [Candidatus Stoquefichus massiliensis]|uniref:hypothetical protein n=1 Tax=Candidatus Stoquefichus massiliensis TaxID=1470350 RepID=UPI000484FE20|nr:hypothetical protein [Candidatus Stoquefichus massiliensis]
MKYCDNILNKLTSLIKNLNLDKKVVVSNLLFLILFFIKCLSDYQYLNYIDEILTVFFVLYLLKNTLFLIKNYKMLLILWMLFLSFGLISNLIYNYQLFFPALIDAGLIVSKFIIAYLAASVYTRKTNFDFIQVITPISKLLVIIFTLLIIHDIFFHPIYPKNEYRYFMESLQLMFGHPTYLAVAMVTLIAILSYSNYNHKNIFYLICCSFIIFTTFRSKAIAFIFVYWMFYIFLFIMKKEINFIPIGIGGIISMLFLTKDTIINYFFSPTRYSPRSILLNDSFDLMIKHFPLGTGFGTFGTTIAEQFYSPLYVKLNYDNNFGMSALESYFLNDSFWPAIFAQTGIFGTAIFCLVIIYFINCILKKYKKSKVISLAMGSIILYLLITSIAESSFFNPTSLLLFILFGQMDNLTNI